MKINTQKGFIVSLAIVVLLILITCGIYWHANKKVESAAEQATQAVSKSAATKKKVPVTAPATTTPASFVVVTSPIGGEVYTKGQTISISWRTSPDMGNSTIIASIESVKGSCKLGSADAFKGTMQVTLQDVNGCIIPLGKHKISLQPFNPATGMAILATSTSPDYFTITQ